MGGTNKMNTWGYIAVPMTSGEIQYDNYPDDRDFWYHGKGSHFDETYLDQVTVTNVTVSSNNFAIPPDNDPCKYVTMVHQGLVTVCVKLGSSVTNQKEYFVIEGFSTR